MALKWLTRLVPQAPNEDANSTDLSRAIAVLMLEVAQSDFEETEEETRTLLAGLAEHLDEDSHTSEDLLASARNDKANSAGLYEFTRLACTEMSLVERCILIEQLWNIAYADGVIDKYEEAAIRKVSELLYVPHSDFIKAKLAAASGLSDTP
jgi:uncharacterized tellurite resistance protein B-like protein